MAELTAQESELRMTIQITRAATGEVEEYEVIATPVPEEPETPKED